MLGNTRINSSGGTTENSIAFMTLPLSVTKQNTYSYYYAYRLNGLTDEVTLNLEFGEQGEKKLVIRKKQDCEMPKLLAPWSCFNNFKVNGEAIYKHEYTHLLTPAFDDNKDVYQGSSLSDLLQNMIEPPIYIDITIPNGVTDISCFADGLRKCQGGKIRMRANPTVFTNAFNDISYNTGKIVVIDYTANCTNIDSIVATGGWVKKGTLI